MASTANPKPPTSTRAGSECCRGVIIGMANGVILALIGGAAAPTVMLSAVGAGAVGALIALLVWSGSGGAPEEPVLPPRNER